MESNPLLPKGRPAPEIQGSRPESMIDITDQEVRPRRMSFVGRRQRRLSHIFGFIWLLLTFLLFIFLVEPGGFKKIRGDFPWTSPTRTIDERVKSILTATPLIDGHNDLAIVVRFIYNNHIYEENFTKPFTEGGMPLHVDLPRLKQGRVGGAFWSAFAPCPVNASDFSDDTYISTVAFTYNQLDLLKRLQAQYPTYLSPPLNSTTALSAFRDGRLISPLAIEGLHQIGNSMTNLRAYYGLGARYITLTHNCHNKYADAALTEAPGGGIAKATPLWGGVSPAGRAVIHEMNRLGMIVDLAHVSQDTMRDVLGGSANWIGSAAPIIFSHSSAYAICPHPRNVPDDILELVKRRNSLVMINFSPDFISCVAGDNHNGLPDFDPENATLKHVVDHIMHIGTLVGYDHVGLGSDFDGIFSVPEGLEDVSKFPDLIAELLRRNVSDHDAAKVVGGNLLRVWSDVDAIALKMQNTGELPLEDALPSLMPEEMSYMTDMVSSL